jgi:putative transposase
MNVAANARPSGTGSRGTRRKLAPRVSNDTPFSEALFRTCKHVPGWPPRGFATIAAARDWVQGFVAWYNTEHRHSAIRFVTPDQRHRGEETAVLSNRHRIYEAARAAHPERRSGKTRQWTPIGSVWLNPDRSETGHKGHGGDDALPHKTGGGAPMDGHAERAA